MQSLLAVGVYGFGAGLIGTLGGLGGAVLLVPVMVIAGFAPSEAVPVGLLTVIASSLAASASQIDSGLVHHRIGIVTEIAASAGGMGGAVVAGGVSDDVLQVLLAAVVVLGALAVITTRRVEAGREPAFAAEAPGEWPGTLAGAAPVGGEIVPYAAERPALGITLMSGVGVVAGLSGVSGGFLKTPILAQVMRIPPRVAAATTTFTVGVTASAALLVFLARGPVEVAVASAAVAGALPGGRLGAVIQARAPERVMRAVLSAALLAIAFVLVATR